jgi:hypothetical protein
MRLVLVWITPAVFASVKRNSSIFCVRMSLLSLYFWDIQSNAFANAFVEVCAFQDIAL